MYFKIDNGRVINSREPIEGGFEKEGLKYECDSGRLVAVGDNDVRDKTDAEILEDRRDMIESSFFSSAEYQVAKSLSPYAYALTLQKASEGDEAALENLAWVEAIWDDHDGRVASLESPYDYDIDFSSHGDKPRQVREYA